MVSLTDKSPPIVTSSGNPTVNVLLVDKSCPPVGVTSISLVVPTNSIVVAVLAALSNLVLSPSTKAPSAGGCWALSAFVPCAAVA